MISHVKSYVELEHFHMGNDFTCEIFICEIEALHQCKGITCEMDSNVKWFGHT